MCLVVIDHHSALVGRSIPPDEYKRMCQKQSTKKVRILLMIEADTMNVSGSYCVLFFCYHAATRTGQISPMCTHF